MRRVFGYTIKDKPKGITEVYERLHTGYGDGIMLRPAIIGNMKKYPERRHVLHIYANIAPIFSDIAGLEVVPIREPVKMQADVAFEWRLAESARHFSKYGEIRLHYLSQPCAEYESKNSPYEKKTIHKLGITFYKEREYWQSPLYYPRIVKKDKQIAVSTGRRVIKSRQKIFCDMVGVNFDINNYNVRFTEEELEYARNNVNGNSPVVGMQMGTSTPSRDYYYMINLAEYVANQGATVLIADYNFQYNGNEKNIHCVGNSNYRYTWATISKCDMFIGADSVGVHAAGSLGIPTYGIFGPTDPACRLAEYKIAKWNDKWSLPILRRGFKKGCGRQYCWYTNCKHLACINTKSPSYYWKDAQEKLGDL